MELTIKEKVGNYIFYNQEKVLLITFLTILFTFGLVIAIEFGFVNGYLNRLTSFILAIMIVKLFLALRGGVCE